MNVTGWPCPAVLTASSECWLILIYRNEDASKKIFVATEILVFDFEFFIGGRHDILGTNLVACENKRGPYRINQYRPRNETNLLHRPCNRLSLQLSSGYSGAGRYNRMSSKYILPAPPGTVALPLVPRPIANLSTSVRSIP